MISYMILLNYDIIMNRFIFPSIFHVFPLSGRIFPLGGPTFPLVNVRNARTICAHLGLDFAAFRNGVFSLFSIKYPALYSPLNHTVWTAISAVTRWVVVRYIHHSVISTRETQPHVTIRRLFQGPTRSQSGPRH